MAEIRWMDGATERVLRLEPGQVFEIGREAGSCLVLDDAEVSRHHARLVPNGDGWAIEDLGSANGTWFKDQRVMRASLRDGDRVRLGNSELVFYEAGAPELGEEAVPQTAAGAEAAYYLSRDGQRLGPYSWPELTTYASNGQVSPDDLLWGPGLEQWTAARQIPGLLPAAPAVGSAPAPPAWRPLLKVFVAAAGVVLLGLVILVFAAVLGGPGGGGNGGDDPATALLDLDDGDWQHYPDLEVEQKKIATTMEAFQSALRKGDIDGAASWIAEDRRDSYAALFAHRPEAMASFADLLDSSAMSNLSPPEQPSANFRLRTAEYTVTIDNFDFYIRWAKVDGTWVLFDF